MKNNRIRKVFCNIRPPGHHCTKTNASGYCIFNNVAIGVKKALEYPDINKVLILDWDLHPGQGTQEIFKCSKNVVMASFYRDVLYEHNETPKDFITKGYSISRGKYYNLYNYPQDNGPDGMKRYLDTFYNKFVPMVIDLEPDIIFISAGFDGHRNDINQGLGLDYNHYKIMTKTMCELANTYSKGRLISVLEGGYTLDVLANCVSVHIKELLENP